MMTHLKTTKHTKGEWSYHNPITLGCDPTNDHSVTTEDKTICIINERVKEHKSNAKLIASAPEMLEALKDIANMCKDHLINNLEFDPIKIMENVEQAIKKAEGV